MRKKSILKSLIVLLSFLFLVFPTLASASDGNSEKSASVQTNGEISFYTDATSEPPASSTDPTVDSSTAPTTTPTTTPSSTLPSTGGKLPTTGEVVKQGLMYGGVALLALALFYIWKRRKNDENKGGMNR